MIKAHVLWCRVSAAAARVRSMSKLSWNWHVFYMLCDPGLKIHEHHPMFHVQVSTWVHKDYTHTQLQSGLDRYHVIVCQPDDFLIMFISQAGVHLLSVIFLQCLPDPLTFALQMYVIQCACIPAGLTVYCMSGVAWATLPTFSFFRCVTCTGAFYDITWSPLAN